MALLPISSNDKKILQVNSILCTVMEFSVFLGVGSQLAFVVSVSVE